VVCGTVFSVQRGGVGGCASGGVPLGAAPVLSWRCAEVSLGDIEPSIKGPHKATHGQKEKPHSSTSTVISMIPVIRVSRARDQGDI